MANGFSHLCQPIRIGGMEIKNRMAVAPMAAILASEDGYVTERLKEIYRVRARGGFGLVVVEATAVHRSGKQSNRMIMADDDSCVAGLNELAETIQEYGAKASIQLMHSGAVVRPGVSGAKAMGPSGITLRSGEKVETMTDSDVEDLITCFVAAARRVKYAGFDLVMLHFAHGLLINQFITPFFNRREDRWGGPTAFAVELLKRVKDAVGDTPVYIRVSGDDFLNREGTANLEFMTRVIPVFEEAGADAIDVSGGQVFFLDSWTFPPIYRPRGCFIHLAEAIKKVVRVPVITVGRINDPRLAENILARGRADIVSFGRQPYADPDFARKVLEGRTEDIRKCIACDGCTLRSGLVRSVLCAINYEFGRMPWECEMRSTDRPKRVMVIGGGVAGMEASRVAKLRGHEVTLYEKDDTLGGAVLSMASAIPRLNTRDLRNIVDWEKTQLGKVGVKVVVGREVTPQVVEDVKPEAVILATGARPLIPEIPGVHSAKVITLDDYLKKKMAVGKRVVVLGGHHGVEVAVSLAIDGKEVVLVEESARIIREAEYLRARQSMLRQHIDNLSIRVMTNTRVKEVSDQGVVVYTEDGREETLEADTVIIASERVPNRELEAELKRIVPELYVIGDCREPQTIHHAIHTAARVGRDL